MNLYQYAPNALDWIDPWGLAKDCSAAGMLPKLKGLTVQAIESILKKRGFTRTRISNSTARNQTWSHPDGSEVRIHPYGNAGTTMRNGQLTPKSGVNGHVHKEGSPRIPNRDGAQLNDRGFESSNPNDTHIGIKNPRDLPQVRNRPHGSGA